MIPIRLLLVAALFAQFGVRASSAVPPPSNRKRVHDVIGVAKREPEVKLVFHYPCEFLYTDDSPYENRVMDFECDYMHASIKNADEAFNALPTLEAQKAFLTDAIDEADSAHNDYMLRIADLLKHTDPSTVSKELTPAKRLEKLQKLDKKLWTDFIEIAKPFLWPPRESETYVERTNGYWPKSWDPYEQPIVGRSSEIQSLADAIQTTLIERTATTLQSKVRPLTRPLQNVSADGHPDPSLDKLFTGSREHAGMLNVPASPAHTPIAAQYSRVMPAPISDLRASPPPLPMAPEERSLRSYFARGAAAGMQRLKDDSNIALWHAAGHTRTVGDPYGKASLIIHQMGGSCGVAAQYEALRARGMDVYIEELAKEALAKGYYTDYALVSGDRAGGTLYKKMNSLLLSHAVKSDVIPNATPEQLDQAIRNSGDAIISAKTKLLWSDPSHSDNGGHIVYVSGEEIDSKGKVLGYYINDTGTGEAARFIHASDFNRAWSHWLVTIHGEN